MKNKIAAVSIYVFNFLEIDQKIKALVKAGVQWIHVDIMDGVFVNNYALCQKFCNDIKTKYPNLIVDAHMMCLEPERYISSFAAAGCDYYIFHYETIRDKNKENLLSIINKVKKAGMKPLMAINPETSIHVFDGYFDYLAGGMIMNINPGFNGQTINEKSYQKIKDLADLKKTKNDNFIVMTDGGCREDTYKKICDAGAEVIVVGAFVNVDESKMNEQFQKIQGV